MVLTALLTALAAHQLGEPPPDVLAPLRDEAKRTLSDASSYIPLPKDLPPASKPVNEVVLGGWSPWAATLWRMAMKEENLTSPSQASYYARQMVKFPRSWIPVLQKELSHEKRHNFNFLGRWIRNRLWVREFAMANFSDNDIYEMTGPEYEKMVNYTSLGPWDKTQHNGNHSTARVNSPWKYELDREYFQTIAASNFTLSPAGDHNYAMRFIDAIAGGSLPVVRSADKDVDSPFWMLTSIPFHYIALDEGTPLVFRQDWVNENTALFVRYCTFIEGDNTPADWKPPAGMKEAIDIAEGTLTLPPATTTPSPPAAARPPHP